MGYDRSKADCPVIAMQSKPISRRGLLQFATVLLAASRTTSNALAATCANTDGSDAGLRESLHYTEAAANPLQQCSACSFFTNPKGSCGQCAIFNGPANASGHCDSWAARA
jgi:High potential iron-sulfur protein